MNVTSPSPQDTLSHSGARFQKSACKRMAKLHDLLFFRWILCVNCPKLPVGLLDIFLNNIPNSCSIKSKKPSFFFLIFSINMTTSDEVQLTVSVLPPRHKYKNDPFITAETIWLTGLLWGWNLKHMTKKAVKLFIYLSITKCFLKTAKYTENAFKLLWGASAWQTNIIETRLMPTP